MILNLYFARRFLRAFLSLALVFALLTATIDLVEQMRRLASSDVRLGQIIELTALNVPKGIYDILPLIMILATVWLFLALARSSELVVVRASGRSALRQLLSPLVVAGLIGVAAVAVMNPLVAATSKRFDTLLEQYRSGGSDTFSVSAEGLWLRQGDENGQTVIRAARANATGTELYDVTMLTYGPEQPGPIRRIEARRARLTDGAWDLTGVKLWPLAQGLNPEADAERHDTFSLPSSLTQERIRDSFGAPSVIPIWQLPAYIAQLEQSGFSARRHIVWLNMELARPLFLMAVMLISAAFTMRHVRFGKTGISVLAAVLLGFTLYYIRNFAQILGENGQIPIMLAAWAPPGASFLLALGLVLHMEDG
ncbi:LPS export ABC transporter permease LptG [Pseudooceanicola aestuarii]|uniref:LPS export ABC transporter permease LptG n=1 Tax=Pseudooceanicola aestuarii TaxID=2697319 RepID=UPI0013D1EA38|nr:LPS export ABC transporter permease LptG [Pseudooceanicola aestuarii]